MKCFYHASDFDGKCANAIVRKMYTDVVSIGVNYSDSLDEILQNHDLKLEPGETVFVVDFSFERYTMDWLDRRYNLIWIDHHETAIQKLPRYRGLQMIGVAGCELTWMYLLGTERPRAVYLLGRYDVWDFRKDKEEILAFQYGLRGSAPDWNSLLEPDCDLTPIIEKGMILYEYEMINNKRYAKSYSKETVLVGLPAIAINKGLCNSLVFDSVYNPDKHKLMIAYAKFNTGVWNYTLFSTHPDVHCGRIAQQFGGGGHAGAAGFQSDMLLV